MKPPQFHRTESETIPTGCPHMRGLLSQLSDGTLRRGLLHWYTTSHVKLCPCCHQALDRLYVLNTELKSLPSRTTNSMKIIGSTDWSKIEAAWDKADLEN